MWVLIFLKSYTNPCMQSKVIHFEHLEAVKRKIYALSKVFKMVQICDSNQTDPALNIGEFELVAGFSNSIEVLSDIDQIESALNNQSWKFGSIEYPNDWKTPIGKVVFFEPEWVLLIKKNESSLYIIENIKSNLQMDDFYTLFESGIVDLPSHLPDFKFTASTSKEEYLDIVAKIREDIRQGVFYEMNYCIEFNAKWQNKDLLPYMLKLNEKASAPFSIYAKSPEGEILCSSPERFLKKSGNQLYSQPIKGTNKLKTGEENLKQMAQLKSSEKERAENVMIVDLVRNDLARVCKTGTIKVKELFGTYPFKTLNHLISTVSGELVNSSSFKDIMLALFPMGSMTGAPKIEVMKHIQSYEKQNRGLYSGCMGYIQANGDFDFNVMIRTLVYEKATSQIHYKVGSAITFDSVAEQEYEECLLKGQRLESLFRE